MKIIQDKRGVLLVSNFIHSDNVFKYDLHQHRTKIRLQKVMSRSQNGDASKSNLDMKKANEEEKKKQDVFDQYLGPISVNCVCMKFALAIL